MSLAGLEDDETALRLVAGIEADWSRLGAGVRVRFWGALIDRHIGKARERLGPRAEIVWAEGMRLSFEETVRVALTHAAGSSRFSASTISK